MSNSINGSKQLESNNFEFDHWKEMRWLDEAWIMELRMNILDFLAEEERFEKAKDLGVAFKVFNCKRNIKSFIGKIIKIFNYYLY